VRVVVVVVVLLAPCVEARLLTLAHILAVACAIAWSEWFVGSLLPDAN
jgi:hypothetical protein